MDPYACVYCAICVDNCPVGCLHMDRHYRKPVQMKEMNRQLQLKEPKKKKKSKE